MRSLLLQLPGKRTVFIWRGQGSQVAKFSSSNGLWYQTHYQILGISREATPKEIKSAYLKLSKELHPDKFLSAGTSPTQSQARHAQFVAINHAYSILSKPKDRHVYDLGLFREIPVSRDEASGYGPSHHGERVIFRQPRDFQERAEMMGFGATNPNFYRTNTLSYLVALGCVAFTVVGYIFHINIARMVSVKHSAKVQEDTVAIGLEIQALEAKIDRYRTMGRSREEVIKAWEEQSTSGEK